MLKVGISALKKIKKSTFIAIILLFIPILIVSPFFIPHHEEFVSNGGIQSVQELGINGSVHFTYVNYGVTRNYAEKIKIFMSGYSDLQFTPLEDYTYEEYRDYEEVSKQFQYETVTNAVASAGSMSNVSTATALNAEMNKILEQSQMYSGDSYGLMIAIGLIEEWQQTDFSHGGKYKIAGTGSLLSDQSVGSIGSIRNKLLTAEENGVDIFFIPKDSEFYEDKTWSNQYEALQVVNEEDLTVRVVPVGNLNEALSVLNSLY
ncbi:hypothetical protein [Paenisporosarcina cavernae]|uniref:Lon proteolytic domain-containing protein n=1 Tax=Paenisporosarcina cavernae TaxID=2320858 RepID=A0A385YUL1_9BACL|nr:hypothetical protein [Paenisporosarcina cavernae]AYC29980.1 hypothetical protein D3873_08870 [Paenisporosarcina cavernae]